jgi:hypothetical protein
MLLSTPRTVPSASGIVFKRSARKFWDLAIEQGWTIRVTTDDKYDRITIDLWNWELATGDDEPRNGNKVRVVGHFDATSGAYTGHTTSQVYRGPNERQIYSHGSYGEKLQDALNYASHGPRYVRETAEKMAKQQAERQARKLRREAMEASVRAKGDSPLGTAVRNRLMELSKVPDVPSLGSQDMYYEERIADWRRAKRIQRHAMAARKLIHSFVGQNDDERFLTAEEAAAYKADEIMKELIGELSRSYGTRDMNTARADAEFVKEFHPNFAPNMESVKL